MNDTETRAAVVGPLDQAVRPVAYLYHDAPSAEHADPMVHSTLLLMRHERMPSYRNETPLVTLAQAQAMVAAERERCAAICDVTPPRPFRPSIEAAHAIRKQKA